MSDIDKTLHEFMTLIKKQHAKNIEKWEGKENKFELIAVLGEEFGEICRCVLENDTEKMKKEIIDISAVLLQLFSENYIKKVITLIGSARFSNEFLIVEKKFTFEGYVVLLPFFHGIKYKEDYSAEEWEMLMGYSFRKIDLADVVFVLNKSTEDRPEGYIGSHTSREIEYAREKNKKILYYTELKSNVK